MFQTKVTISATLLTKLDSLKHDTQGDGIMRNVATTMLGIVHDRIHVKGLNAANTAIGTYTPGYMKVRTGDFGNSGKISRGKNKGELKNAGSFSRGAHKGEPRPKYNRSSDNRVIISLTRQMENDFKIVATDQGYGLGYSNDENFKKAGWVEETYHEKIFTLTAAERQQAVEIAKQEILKIFNQ